MVRSKPGTSRTSYRPHTARPPVHMWCVSYRMTSESDPWHHTTRVRDSASVEFYPVLYDDERSLLRFPSSAYHGPACPPHGQIRDPDCNL